MPLLPILLLATVFALAPTGSAAAQAVPDAARLAVELLDHLDAGRYTQAEAMFDAKMAQAVPADKLKAVWESLPQQAGPACGRGDADTVMQDGVQMVKLPLCHEQAGLVASVAVDARGRIAGLLIQPAPATTPVPAPAVTDDAPFTERDAAVGADQASLPGTLAMPRGDGPFPAVVLVHGSGPHDRDQTLGPNKPFADIARGLAARGVAVLRYDKRSKVRPQDYAGGITIDSETTDDAVAAVGTLRATPGIDPKRIFVLGHSQGAMLAPRIASRADAHGMILFAAPARPLLDILVEQFQRQAVLDDGKTDAEEAARIATLRQQVAAARSQVDAPAETMPLGQSQAYWRSVEAVDPVAEAVATTMPILILQGGRDIQVVDADWQRWRASFEGDRKATLTLYPALSHLGIAGEGPGGPQDYATPGKVDEAFIADIATWIKAQ